MVEKTIAIIDLAHNGTTMLAGILEILGVPMVGGRHHTRKWEDHDIIEGLRRNDTKKFTEEVAKRDAKHKVWGFKCVGAWRYFDVMDQHLTNPVYLAIFKDPVSVTYRRWQGDKNDFVRKVRNTLNQMKESINEIYNSGRPTHLYSYTKAIVVPKMFIRRLVGDIGLEVTEGEMDRAAAYIQPNVGYAPKMYPSIKDHL